MIKLAKAIDPDANQRTFLQSIFETYFIDIPGLGTRSSINLRSSEVYVILLITYNLHDSPGKYKALHRALARYKHCQFQHSVWLLDTFEKPASVYRKLTGIIGVSGQLLVTRIYKEQFLLLNDADRISWLKDPGRFWD